MYYYDPQSAGINLQSPQSDSTPWTLTLGYAYMLQSSPDEWMIKKCCILPNNFTTSSGNKHIIIIFPYIFLV